MSLINNAISSIQVGIEDYQSNDNRRHLTAIRNIHAGILLLCKVKLQALSPEESDEALLKQKIVPQVQSDGGLKWIGKGKKTVDQQQIEERFKQLGIKLNWNKFNKINDIRNTLEHYYFSGTRDQVREAFAEACLVIRQLIMDVLQQNPTTLIGAGYWDTLYNIHEVFEHELKACQASLAPIEWLKAAKMIPSHIECPHCESKLVSQVDPLNKDQAESRFRCTSCADECSPETLIPHVLGKVYFADYYLSMTDGGEPPVVECPECCEESYVLEHGSCALCDFSIPADAECAVCGEPLSIEDYGNHGSLCGYHAYVADRERDR